MPDSDSHARPAQRRAAPGPLDPVFLGGSVNLLAGSSGVGKTALFAFMARCFLRGEEVFGHRPPSIPHVAYVGVDKSWAGSSSKWFALEGIPKVRHYCLPDDKHFRKRRLRTKNDRTAIFHECLAKVSPNGQNFPAGSLVFFDPIALFLGGNLMDYDACAVACLELRESCQDMGDVCVIGSVHGGKIQTDKKNRYVRLQDHILGSAALYGYSDTQMYLASPEELGQKHATFLLAPHHQRPETFRMVRDAEGRYLLDGSSDGPGSDVPYSWLHQALALAPDSTLPSADILKLAIEREVNRRTLFRLLNQELAAGRITKVSHGIYKLLKPS